MELNGWNPSFKKCTQFERFKFKDVMICENDLERQGNEAHPEK